MRKQLGMGVALAALLAAACGIGAQRVHSESATRDVTIDNFSFDPQTITVPKGTRVVWKNRDDIPHTVVSDDKSTFKSHALDTDDSFSYTFDKPGTYGYFCSIHPKMTAKVVVQ